MPNASFDVQTLRTKAPLLSPRRIRSGPNSWALVVAILVECTAIYGVSADVVVKLGGTLSLTKHDDAISKAFEKGIVLLAKKVNSSGAIRLRNGSKLVLELHIKDDRADPITCFETYDNLIRFDGVNFLLGPANSELSTMAAAVGQDMKRITMLPGAATPSLYQSNNRYIFSTNVMAPEYMTNGMQSLWSLGARTVVFLVERSSFNTAVCSGAVAEAERLGFKVMSQVVMGTNALTFQIRNLKALDPDVLVACGSAQDAISITVTLRALSFSPKAVLMTMAADRAYVHSIGAPNANFIMSPVTWAPSLGFPDGVFGSSQGFADLYAAEWGEMPTYHSAQAAAAGLALLAAIQTAGTFDTETVRTELLKLDLPTFYARLRFNQNGTRLGVESMTQQVQALNDADTTSVMTTLGRLSSGKQASGSATPVTQDQARRAMRYEHSRLKLIDRVSQIHWPMPSWIEKEIQVYPCDPGDLWTSINRTLVYRCVPCKIGTYRHPAGLHCEQCQAGQYSDAKGLSSCAICPKGADCPGVFRPGRPNATVGHYKLPLGPLRIVPCQPRELCLGANVCKGYNKGVLCEQCEFGYTRHGLGAGNKNCKNCTSDAWNALLIMVVASFYTLYIWVVSRTTTSSSGAIQAIHSVILKVCVNYLQFAGTAFEATEFISMVDTIVTTRPIPIIAFISISKSVQYPLEGVLAFDCMLQGTGVHEYQVCILLGLLLLPVAFLGKFTFSFLRKQLRLQLYARRRRRRARQHGNTGDVEKGSPSSSEDSIETVGGCSGLRSRFSDFSIRSFERGERSADRDETKRSHSRESADRAETKRSHSREALEPPRSRSMSSESELTSSRSRSRDAHQRAQSRESNLRQSADTLDSPLSRDQTPTENRQSGGTTNEAIVSRFAKSRHARHNEPKKEESEAGSSTVNQTNMREWEAVQEMMLHVVQSSIVMGFVLHPLVTRLLLVGLECTELDELRLKYDYDVVCSSEAHQVWMYWSVFGLFFYGAGTPLVVFLMLYRVRHQLLQIQVRKKYGFLYSGFELHFYFFEAVNMLRKVAVLLVAMIPSMNQRMCMMLVLAWSFILLHVKTRPYDNRSYECLDALELANLRALAVTVAARLTFDMRKENSGIVLTELMNHQFVDVLIILLPLACHLWFMFFAAWCIFRNAVLKHIALKAEVYGHQDLSSLERFFLKMDRQQNQVFYDGQNHWVDTRQLTKKERKYLFTTLCDTINRYMDGDKNQVNPALVSRAVQEAYVRCRATKVEKAMELLYLHDLQEVDSGFGSSFKRKWGELRLSLAPPRNPREIKEWEDTQRIEKISDGVTVEELHSALMLLWPQILQHQPALFSPLRHGVGACAGEPETVETPILEGALTLRDLLGSENPCEDYVAQRSSNESLPLECLMEKMAPQESYATLLQKNRDLIDRNVELTSENESLRKRTQVRSPCQPVEGLDSSPALCTARSEASPWGASASVCEPLRLPISSARSEGNRRQNKEALHQSLAKSKNEASACNQATFPDDGLSKTEPSSTTSTPPTQSRDPPVESALPEPLFAWAPEEGHAEKVRAHTESQQKSADSPTKASCRLNHKTIASPSSHTVATQIQPEQKPLGQVLRMTADESRGDHGVVVANQEGMSADCRTPLSSAAVSQGSNTTSVRLTAEVLRAVLQESPPHSNRRRSRRRSRQSASVATSAGTAWPWGKPSSRQAETRDRTRSEHAADDLGSRRLQLWSGPLELMKAMRPTSASSWPKFPQSPPK